MGESSCESISEGKRQCHCSLAMNRSGLSGGWAELGWAEWIPQAAYLASRTLGPRMQAGWFSGVVKTD